MIRAYYNLAKPGIIYGNIITTLAGFFLASGAHVNLVLLIATVAGISLVMASGCVVNNFIDRNIDRQMSRTQNRALVTGAISVKNALIYSAILGLLGFFILYFHTNTLTTIVAAIGWVVYVAIYSPLKHRTVHATLLGSIAGAVPPVVGYCAVTNHFDTASLLLFAVLVVWQMPHFYSIALFRLNEYMNAQVPVLPVKVGVRATKVYILVYILIFIAASSLLAAYAGWIYLGVVELFALIWLVLAWRGFRVIDTKLWARSMFKFSLIVLLVFSLMVSIGSLFKIGV